MKIRWIVLLLLLLVAGALGALLGENRFGGGTDDVVERNDAEHVASPLASHDTTPSAPADPGPTLAGEGTEGSRPIEGSGETATGVPGRAEPTEVEVVATYAGEVPAGWHAAPPVQRPHAIRPPRPRGPAAGPGGPSGGVGPTGHWSRFPPPAPPHGDATIHVAVTDEHGAPVSDADVYLGPRESLGAQAVSFGDLRKLGATDERGELVAPDLPAGAAVLVANVANQLNGPRGLDARSGIPVLLVSRAVVAARVRLPFDAGAFGAIRGRAVDTGGRPIARAEIWCGYFQTYADAEGAFAAPHLPAGPRTLSARRTGYATATVEVEVPRGGEREIEIVLDWAEQGDLRLEGRVLTAEGAGLEDATVYLIDETGRGTLRSVTTDANGAYVFENLPERLRTSALLIQADRFRDGYAATNVRLAEGLPDAAVDVRLPPRRVKVRFALSDAGTGDPIDRCRIEVERRDDADARPRGFTGSRSDGVFEHFYPAGRYRFTVEAPDREARTVEADLAPPGGAVDLSVAFPSPQEAAVEVTVRVRVLDRVTHAPVTACSIVVLDVRGEEVARFVGHDPEGLYSLPAPSGPRVLRVSAEGYEPTEEPADLPAEPPEASLSCYLAPR